MYFFNCNIVTLQHQETVTKIAFEMSVSALLYTIVRDVAKISNRWDYVDGRRVLWVTLKSKS